MRNRRFPFALPTFSSTLGKIVDFPLHHQRFFEDLEVHMEKAEILDSDSTLAKIADFHMHHQRFFEDLDVHMEKGEILDLSKDSGLGPVVKVSLRF